MTLADRDRSCWIIEFHGYADVFDCKLYVSGARTIDVNRKDTVQKCVDRVQTLLQQDGIDVKRVSPWEIMLWVEPISVSGHTASIRPCQECE